MKIDPSSHRNNFDFVENLVQEIKGKKDQENNYNADQIAKCPHVRVSVGGLQTTVLLDSGSQISAVSEIFYRELVSKGLVQELPVTNLIISTAIGKKSIKRQIFIQSKIEDMKFEDPFLVVPYLASKIILGHDWLSKNNVILNYEQSCIEICGKRLTDLSVVFERGAPEALVCTRRYDAVYVYVVEIQDLSGEGNDKLLQGQVRKNDEKINIKKLFKEDEEIILNKTLEREMEENDISGEGALKKNLISEREWGFSGEPGVVPDSLKLLKRVF